MTDGERLYLEARLKMWRNQYRALAIRGIDYVNNGGEFPQHFTSELSRLSWLIGKAKEKLRMTRYMYDSTNPQHIPPNARIVAYYPHAWGTDLSAHAGALQIRIDNRGDHADDCHVLDVESGAATNTIAAEWVASWHKLHPAGLDCVNGWIRRPVLYTSTSNLTALRSAVNNTNVDYWAAQWDNNTTPVAGCFAKQYADSSRTGGDYDASMVYDDTWGVKPSSPVLTPPPPPVPHPSTLAALLVWGVSQDVCSWKEVHSTDGGKTWS